MDAIKSRNESKKKQMSPSQEKRMMKEIHRQCAEYYRKHENELIALILWQLHIQPDTEFGKKRLRRFYENFEPVLDEMLTRYELDFSDRAWICTQKLKEYGIDIEQWQKESEADFERKSEEEQ